MIEIPRGPYICDFITDFMDNIYHFIHDKWYKSDKNMYNFYTSELDNCIKIKDFIQRKKALYTLRSELLSLFP